jgi:hypothetical protein
VEQCEVGDWVRIRHVQRVSKLKHFAIDQILLRKPREKEIDARKYPDMPAPRTDTVKTEKKLSQQAELIKLVKEQFRSSPEAFQKRKEAEYRAKLEQEKKNKSKSQKK